jgi:hypothetical protein
MSVPAQERDAQWLAYSLQEAVQLEWSTIPPYLCAYWSIKTDGVSPSTADIAGTISDIVVEEMLHMALACNMLAGIGGTPNIYSPNFAPKYPGALPGHVHPGLTIGLAGLSRGVPGDKSQVEKFTQIELPEEPLAQRVAGFPTIGEFYDAVCRVLDQVNPAFRPERQLTNPDPYLTELTVIASVAEAKCKIDLIKRQGEGTSSSPFVDGTTDRIKPAHELAHYYRFEEIYTGRRLQLDSSAPHGWSFSGAELCFPQAGELYLMAEVPPCGYPESDDFDKAYTTMLQLLHNAWAVGDGTMLDTAINANMAALTTAAITLLGKGYPAGTGPGIKGPDFRFLPS